MSLSHWNIKFRMGESGAAPGELQDMAHALTQHYANDLQIARFHCDLKICFYETHILNADHAAGLMTRWSPRQFQIDLALYNNWAVFLAHEMVHVRQCLRKQVNPAWTHWQGVPVPPSLEYHQVPWEAEALELQWALAKNFYDIGKKS